MPRKSPKIAGLLIITIIIHVDYDLKLLVQCGVNHPRCHVVVPDILVAYMNVTCISTAQMGVASMAITCVVMVYIAMACIVVLYTIAACIFMADIVMAHILVVCIGMVTCVY